MVADNALFQASVRAQHQTLIDGLVALNPKKRTAKMSWVIFAGCAYFVGALIADASVREALLTPRGEARASQYVATAPRMPVQPMMQAQVQQPVVMVPAFAVPAPEVEAVDSPLPHAKAHHTAPTKRAHSRGARHAK